jgi:membrane-bound metal-dependent hydrolase YbcI (DUF457 family)
MQDAIHIGIIREFSHNFLGSAIMFIIVFLLLKKMGLVEKCDAPVMAFAASVHVIGDFMFSGFNPFFPLVNSPTTVWGFNSPENIVAEAVLGITFVLAAYVLGEWKRLGPYISERIRKFYQQKWLPVRDLYFYPLYLYSVMMSMSIIQLAIGIHYNAENAIGGIWYSILFLAVFLCYLVAFGSAVFSKRTSSPRS